jgi:glycerol-3-phosphate acyltransferase PlsX
VGSESSKGSEAVVATHAMLAESTLNFIGNVEGNGIIFDKADVLVCDGFVGNILLKFYESIPKFIMGAIGQDLSGERVAQFKEKFNEETYGGADLLGVNGVVVICHGSSTPTAIKNAILKAEKMVNKKINQIIENAINKDPLLFE